ncbi:hypothetical protein SAMN02910292_02596 [Lachnospiraceae bacterium XBB2008]|nr:hypothetical protein SAMN02910292_02596 [Lachnospiraceae bacterium XBB2008]
MDSTSISRACYLTIDEFLLLLYKGSIGGLIFPCEITETISGEKELKKALTELAQNRSVISDCSNGLLLSELAKKWLVILQNTEETKILYNMKGNSIVGYIYTYSDESLYLSLDKHKIGMIRIELLMINNLIDKIIDMDIQPLIKKIRKNETEPYDISEEIEKI